MSFELTMLAWTLVQILLLAFVRNREVGMKYQSGPRDAATPPPGKLSGRLMRAQTNLYETLPIFAIAVLIVHITGRENVLTHYGALMYFVARLVYVPLYAGGVLFVRSIVWLISIVGIVQILVPII